jgi:hypothetical protein
MEIEQSGRVMSGGYKSATGNRSFMFVLGAVFARTQDDAEGIANRNFMRGDDAVVAYKELCGDYVAANRRAAIRRCHG